MTSFKVVCICVWFSSDVLGTCSLVLDRFVLYVLLFPSLKSVSFCFLIFQNLVENIVDCNFFLRKILLISRRVEKAKAAVFLRSILCNNLRIWIINDAARRRGRMEKLILVLQPSFVNMLACCFFHCFPWLK